MVRRQRTQRAVNTHELVLSMEKQFPFLRGRKRWQAPLLLYLVKYSKRQGYSSLLMKYYHFLRSFEKAHPKTVVEWMEGVAKYPKKFADLLYHTESSYNIGDSLSQMHHPSHLVEVMGKISDSVLLAPLFDKRRSSHQTTKLLDSMSYPSRFCVVLENMSNPYRLTILVDSMAYPSRLGIVLDQMNFPHLLGGVLDEMKSPVLLGHLLDTMESPHRIGEMLDKMSHYKNLGFVLDRLGVSDAEYFGKVLDRVSEEKMFSLRDGLDKYPQIVVSKLIKRATNFF
ncbi:MAG: hypothetical protein V1776_01345 [Candidatus Diapherotrites archaeon]